MNEIDELALKVQEKDSYVWMDVFCIHQQDTDEKAAEIKRQAAIFKGAKTAYIWLTTHTNASLQRCFRDIYYSSEQMFQAIEKGDEICTSILQIFASALERLTDDEWFSSLWTLQEAFLRQDAQFLDRKGDSITMRFNDDFVQMHLQWLTDIGKKVDDLLRELLSAGKMDYKRQKLDAHRVRLVLYQTGLAALGQKHAMSLYSTAWNRRTRRVVDRILGIMQVFGASFDTPPADMDEQDALNSLEDQLALFLASKSVTMSQLFTFNCPQPLGKSWRISEHIDIPRRFINISIIEDFTTMTLGPNGLAVIRASKSSWSDYLEIVKHRSSFKIFPDRTGNIWTQLPTKTRSSNPISAEEQEEILNWVNWYSHKKELFVLPIGVVSRDGEEYCVALVVEKTPDYYHRLGLAEWTLVGEAPEKSWGRLGSKKWWRDQGANNLLVG
jgi:Heterokaryon incompatibility protein (HET)